MLPKPQSTWGSPTEIAALTNHIHLGLHSMNISIKHKVAKFLSVIQDQKATVSLHR